jgi:ABC-2 type transport system permease protein
MAVIIVFFVVSAINIDIFSTIKPYLFTNYILSWRLFFDDPIDAGEIIKAVAILSGHVVFLYVISAIIFKRKDVLS